MNAPVSILAPLDRATLAKVTLLARARGISEAEFAAEAIRAAATQQTDFDAFIQVGIDSAERGEVHTQEEVEAWFEERIAARRRG
ncbi:hypothetical protein ASG29_07715 [Sphingomonas sp. Leaf412]|uniref:hypothetical protein n=1 Tax=Sphingomonas sp. Leaf412 TaxID=1736370 RepID=UPI0006F84713|nr:hypothetical protein [Sphingomonas sp. Leaf412]KQT31789.1 hypothetical protein ASG29_07715 [Sphingomonas sp. Leaf412]